MPASVSPLPAPAAPAIPVSLPPALSLGDPFPWLLVRSRGKSQFACTASRYSLLCFGGTLGDAVGAGALKALRERQSELSRRGVQSYFVSVDKADEARLEADGNIPGPIPLFDDDFALSRACFRVSGSGSQISFSRGWILVDPTLHVLATFEFPSQGDNREAVFRAIEALPLPDQFAGFEIPAPVLVLPNVFEPQLCDALIAYYEERGGVESGVYQSGSNALDTSFKRRKDVHIAREDLRGAVYDRFRRRVAPEIRKLFFTDMTRMERYLIGCYSAEDGGRFGAHRDIGAAHTAHRRFALSVNLNADFEGGSVLFPEYNVRPIKPPKGWAVVFPAAILHSVSRVTRGARYAFLDFLYDEAGERLRRQAGVIGG